MNYLPTSFAGEARQFTGSIDDFGPLDKAMSRNIKKNLKVMDSTAISLCKDNNLPIVIFNLNRRGNIKRVVTGEKIGSLVSA